MLKLLLWVGRFGLNILGLYITSQAEATRRGKFFCGKRLNPARNVALYLAQRYTGLGNVEIGRFFGGLHYSAVSKAAARVREAMAADRELEKVVRRLDSHFKA